MKSSLSEETSIDKELRRIHKNSSHQEYWNISWEQGKFLSQLVRLKRPIHILEVGTSNGFSTLWIERGLELEPRNFYTVEVDEKRFQEAQQHFKNAGVKHIRALNGEIFDILHQYPFDIAFDFIFLDAAQRRYGELFTKMEEKGLFQNGALLVADNVVSHQLKDFEHLVAQKYPYQMYCLGGGMLVAHVVREETREESS